MAISHPSHGSQLTLVGYCTRVALALAIIALGLEVAVHYWPCQIARLASCPS
jgi:hypothetical protein